MMEDLMMEWADKVWRGRPGAFFRPSAGLVMDSISAHLTPKVKSHFKLKTNLSEWAKRMQEGIHTYTQSGKMRKAKFAEV
jgi:hypothetical protein